MKIYSLTTARRHLQNGKIVAYPTEAVFGLGCDPWNVQAVKKLFKIKHRPATKGVILLAASWRQIAPLVQWNEIKPRRLAAIRKTWPGPITWVLPATSKVPRWVRGQHNTVAIRITAHPTAKRLCTLFGRPIVSTSANITTLEPARKRTELAAQFPTGLAGVTTGRVGRLQKPTAIYDAITGKTLRKNK